MNVSLRDHRVKHYSRRRAPRIVADLVRTLTDPRSRRGRRWAFADLIGAVFGGLLGNCRSLRHVESLSERVRLADGPQGRALRRVPDTTLAHLLADLEPAEVAPVVARQVHDLNRLGEVEPFGLPCGVTTVDGKSFGRIGHDANGAGLLQHDEKDGAPYWHVRVLRAVLSSAVTVPCLGQQLVPADAGEIDTFPCFAHWLHDNYGRHGLFDIIDVDAGFLSRANWDYVDQELQYGLIARLKANQPGLHDVAREELEALSKRTQPEAVTAWERYQGKEIRRKLWRTDKLDGYAGWQNLRQAWLVVVETREETNKLSRKQRRELGINRREYETTIEHRYYVSNLRWNRLTPQQILLCVRNHWAVENDCFHSLDVQWGEDRPAWCSTGNALQVLGMLRILAYNLVCALRRRHVAARPAAGKLPPEPLAWRDTWMSIREVLPRLWEPDADACGGAGRPACGPPNLALAA
jgi:hypothetical protein